MDAKVKMAEGTIWTSRRKKCHIKIIYLKFVEYKINKKKPYCDFLHCGKFSSKRVGKFLSNNSEIFFPSIK